MDNSSFVAVTSYTEITLNRAIMVKAKNMCLPLGAIHFLHRLLSLSGLKKVQVATKFQDTIFLFDEKNKVGTQPSDLTDFLLTLKNHDCGLIVRQYTQHTYFAYVAVESRYLKTQRANVYGAIVTGNTLTLSHSQRTQRACLSSSGRKVRSCNVGTVYTDWPINNTEHSFFL